MINEIIVGHIINLDCNGIWIHNTNKKNVSSILNNGFKLPKEGTRFGRGIYFTKSGDYCSEMYTSIQTIITTPVWRVSHADLCKIFNTPEYQFQPEEEGIPFLEEYVKEREIKAVEITYIDGFSELIVYDTGSIQIAI